MDDYKNFPPCKYFLRVLKNCPQSAYLYFCVWKNTGKSTGIDILKKDIRKKYLISPTLFRSYISSLHYLGIIDFEEKDEKFRLEMYGSDD